MARFRAQDPRRHELPLRVRLTPPHGRRNVLPVCAQAPPARRSSSLLPLTEVGMGTCSPPVARESGGLEPPGARDRPHADTPGRPCRRRDPGPLPQPMSRLQVRGPTCRDDVQEDAGDRGADEAERGVQARAVVLHRTGERVHAEREEQGQQEDDVGVAEGEEEADGERALPVRDQLAGGVGSQRCDPRRRRAACPARTPCPRGRRRTPPRCPC